MTSSFETTRYRRKNDAVTAIILSTACLILYSLTCCPTVYTGDSGELIAASAAAGVAHPTGFPLYTLTARLASLFASPGEPAYGVNLLSALLAALSSGVLFLAMRRVPGAAGGALPAAVLFALSANTWGHATTARIYAFGIFFLAALLFLTFEWRFGLRDGRLLILAAFVLGLGTGTHLLVILAGPAFLTLLLPFGAEQEAGAPRLNMPLLLAATAAAAAGATIYLYLPIRASQAPLVTWADPSTLSSLFDFVTQKEFAYKIATRSAGGAAAVLAEAASVIRRDLTLPGLAAAAFGILRTARKNPALLAPFFVIIAGNLFIMLQYGNREDLFVLFRYLWPAEIALTVFAAAGLEGIFEFTGTTRARLNKPESVKPPGRKRGRGGKQRADTGAGKTTGASRAVASSRMSRTAPAILAAAAALIMISLNFNTCNLRGEFTARDHGANLLAAVEEPALLLVAGDAVFGPADYYMNRTQGGRDGVVVFIREFLDRNWYCTQVEERYPGLFPPGGLTGIPAGRRLAPLAAFNADSLNIYVTFDDPGLSRAYAAVPEGPAKRLYRPGEVPPLPELARRSEAAWSRCDTARIRRSDASRDELIGQIVDFYARGLNDHGVLLSRADRFEDAERVFRRAGGFDPGNLEILLNLGTTLEQLSRPEDAAACFESVIGAGAPGSGQDGREKLFARFRLGMLMTEVGNRAAANRELRILRSLSSPQAARYAAALDAALGAANGDKKE